MDAEGYLKITNRVKDVIKSGGEWISSVDMGNELMPYDPVLEAAVVGIKHPRWEERPLALVILREKHLGRIGKNEILSHLAKKFAKRQLPDEILFVDEIPETTVGKINKKVIREMHRDRYMCGVG
jgi:fatty-acyl-CoA synthase